MLWWCASLDYGVVSVPALLWCCWLRCATGVAYVLAFTVLMNYFAYVALKYYSGQEPRASVGVLVVG